MFTDLNALKRAEGLLEKELDLKTNNVIDQKTAVTELLESIQENTLKDGLLNKKASEFNQSTKQGCCTIV